MRAKKPVMRKATRAEKISKPAVYEVEDKKPLTTTEMLKQRGNRYGSFVGHAKVTQGLKELIRMHLEQRDKALSDDQQEAMDMICHKIGRIINGDADYFDSWKDIAGYAQLVSDRLEKGVEL